MLQMTFTLIHSNREILFIYVPLIQDFINLPTQKTNHDIKVILQEVSILTYNIPCI